MSDRDTLREALDVMPGCGHWIADHPNSWSFREPESGEYRIVCEAIIETGSGQRYCLDEGRRVEPYEIDQWLRAARSCLSERVNTEGADNE